MSRGAGRIQSDEARLTSDCYLQGLTEGEPLKMNDLKTKVF